METKTVTKSFRVDPREYEKFAAIAKHGGATPGSLLRLMIDSYCSTESWILLGSKHFQLNEDEIKKIKELDDELDRELKDRWENQNRGVML